MQYRNKPSHGQAPAPTHFGDEAHVAIPQMLLGAACSAIDKKRDGTKVLAELRRYTTGDLSRAIAPAPAAVAGPREAVKFTDQSTADPVEKARRYLTAMGSNHLHSSYFFDDGYPKQESAADALATLAVLEQLAAAPTAQPAPQQEAQEQAAVPRFNCWTTNGGDSWFDHPADSQAIYDCLGNDAKVGDEYELTAGWRSVTARYRITEVVGDGEEYEVECISHQQENTAPQPASQGDALDAARYRFLRNSEWDDSTAIYHALMNCHGPDSAEELDAAIDAARAVQEKKQ